jgi:cell division protein FtsL
MQRIPEQQRNARVRRAHDKTALSRLALLLFCAFVLAGGFVFAAKQHFAAVQYGYQSESLRNEKKQLIEDNQRLALEKEQASAPSRLEPAARQLGLLPATAGQISGSSRSAKSNQEVTRPKSSAEKSSKR